VEAKEGLEASKVSTMTAPREVQPKRLSSSKPVSDVLLNQDGASGTVQTILEDASDVGNGYKGLRHNSNARKATATADTKRRYLKKNSARKAEKKASGEKQDKKGSGRNVDKADYGKSSKRGQTTRNYVDTQSGVVDSSTVVQQDEQSNQGGDTLSTLDLPSLPDNNIFDHQRSFDSPAPSPKPTTAEPTVMPTFPPTIPPTLPPTLPPTIPPTTRIPTEAPTVNTPVPTFAMTESLYPTDSSTFGVTFEFTTISPSSSPAPTA